MISRHCARLAGVLVLCSVPALSALAQSRVEGGATRAEVALARPAAASGSALVDSAPCVGDDDFHRFDGSPVPGAALPDPLPVARVVLADRESPRARDRARRVAERGR